MKCGLLINPIGVTWTQVRDLIVLADQLGYHSAWIADHLMPYPGDRDLPVLEAWTTLAGLAEATDRIRLGTLVTSATFRQPAVLAKMAVTIDQMSGGRLTLGLGVGNFAEEHTTYGIPFRSARDRSDLLAETCQVLRGLWSGQPFSYDGRYAQLADAPCQPGPVQPTIPILIGGSGERRSLPLVARFADQWNMPPQPDGLSPALFARKHSVLRGLCEPAGRDPAAIETSIALVVLVDRDRATALDRQRKLSAALGWPDDGMDRSIAGDPALVADRLQEYQAAGVDQVINVVVSGVNDGDGRLFAEQVMNRFG